MNTSLFKTSNEFTLSCSYLGVNKPFDYRVILQNLGLEFTFSLYSTKRTKTTAKVMYLWISSLICLVTMSNNRLNKYAAKYIPEHNPTYLEKFFVSSLIPVITASYMSWMIWYIHNTYIFLFKSSQKYFPGTRSQFILKLIKFICKSLFLLGYLSINPFNKIFVSPMFTNSAYNYTAYVSPSEREDPVTSVNQGKCCRILLTWSIYHI